MQLSNYLILSVCFLASCSSKPSNTNNTKAKTVPSVSIQVVTPIAIDNVIQTTGTLQANEWVELRPETNGVITALNFTEGKAVQQGQLLLKINDDDLIAERKKAQIALRFAHENSDRNSKLLAIEAISTEDFDKVVNDLKKAEADLEYIDAQLAKKIIKSPFNGVMGLRNVSVGQYVSAGTLLATINQLNPLKIDFAIPEKYVQLIKSGSNISFTVEGDTNHYNAQIYAINNAIDVVTRSVMVRATCDNSKGLLHAGAFAKVSVSLGNISDALMIPADVLMPELGGNKIYILSNGKAIARQVATGLRNATSIEITSGLQPGDTIITSGLLMLKDSMPVKSIIK